MPKHYDLDCAPGAYTVTLAEPEPFVIVPDEDTCTCASEAHEEHPCPYQSDINEDDTLCTCCPVCEQECADKR